MKLQTNNYPNTVLVRLYDSFSVCVLTIDHNQRSSIDFVETVEENEEEPRNRRLYDFRELYEDSPDFEIPYDLIAELEEKDKQWLANRPPSKMSQNKKEIAAAMQKYQRHEKDVGSPEAQIAALNERIKYLTVHMLANRKDFSSRRGLTALVNQRRVMLNYLYKKRPQSAYKIAEELGIRFRPPGQVWDRETRYAAFKNTKQGKKDKPERRRAPPTTVIQRLYKKFQIQE